MPLDLARQVTFAMGKRYKIGWCRYKSSAFVMGMLHGEKEMMPKEYGEVSGLNMKKEEYERGVSPKRGRREYVIDHQYLQLMAKWRERPNLS
jgi:hypothetical protein